MPFPGVAQSNQLWKGYYSYNSIRDLAQAPMTIYAASENALFSKNLGTNVLKTTTTVDGLSGQTISALYHSEVANLTLIGYANGLMIVINEADGSMTNVVDILNKQLQPNIKKINHFMEYDGIVYVSCDFGIVQYNLATLEFGDTYFIGSGVAEIIVNQTTVFEGNIYAATQDNGIKRADITNPNLVDASQWTQIAMGNWSGIESFGTNLVAAGIGGTLYKVVGTSFNFFAQLSGATADLRATDDYLIATSSANVNVYGPTLNLVKQFTPAEVPEITPVFTAATVTDETLFVGTAENGVIATTVSGMSQPELLSPDGPVRNNIFSINASTQNLWAVYGFYIDYNPYPLNTYGVSKHDEDGWKEIPYSELHLPDKQAHDLVRVTINPNNINEVYISSYHSGLLKLEDDVLVEQYDHTNSGLESLVDPGAPNERSIRIEQSAFDKQGNLWMTNSLVRDGLKVLHPDETWDSYNTEAILDNAYFSTAFSQLVIDKNSTKWIATHGQGVVGFNEAGNIFKKITMGSDNGNLPSQNVRAVAVDKRNQLWIGTEKGLRVLSSVDRFLNEDQLTANAIIILDEEEDVAQELLYEQLITDIAVDGGNNKWIATADGGAFLVSPNGQETIYHFTTENSPLPSNVINDIDINGDSGEVFFATNKGMVSFKGISTDAKGDLSNVIVYPNPVRPDFYGTVKIGGLIDKANVKITDIEGNLVHETTAEGGTIEWDTTAFGKHRVSSGVYMIFIAAEDAIETKVTKVMIIR